MMETIVHNFFSTEAGLIWLVLKWALVVLAAGFIGQFGKAFATYLIRRAGAGTEKGTVPAAPPPALRQEAVPRAAQQAAESLSAEGTAVAADVEALREARDKQEKKASREQQKAAKKALKGIKKLFK
ncbi:MAG: hypothetical protein MUF17_11675 [Syntrophales bacterium]|jgi:hypothetical protein|nr:hypothetical protein [Syntrophales bacterium]